MTNIYNFYCAILIFIIFLVIFYILQYYCNYEMFSNIKLPININIITNNSRNDDPEIYVPYYGPWLYYYPYRQLYGYNYPFW